MASTVYTTAPWTFPSVANYSGRYIASDPTILVDGGIFRMFYTDLFDNGATRTVIGGATSTNGRTWTNTRIVVNGSGGDEANLEGACIFRAGKYVLLYSTYADGGDPIPGLPAKLRAAVSTDGVTFTRSGLALAPTQGWYDNDAIYSPTVFAYPGGYLMLYCGHCYTDASAINGNFGVSLLAATSPDGLHWAKHQQPVLRANPAISWMSEGAAEPSLILGPDGNYYLFFSGVAAGESRAIGIAFAANPLGPWDVTRTPIITTQNAGLPADGVVIAAHAELISGVLRLWYTEVTPGGGRYSVAYAESDWGGGSLTVISSRSTARSKGTAAASNESSFEPRLRSKVFRMAP